MNDTLPTREERDELYAAAATQWGHEAQWNKAAEEFAELSATLNRALNDQADLDEILEELADAQIMLEQLQWHLREERVDEAVAEKIGRLEGMLDG